MSDTLDLVQSLVDASSEEVVTTIIQSHPLLRDPSAWHPYVPPEKMGIVLNQQSHPVSSLTERIVNSIDAVLTKECLLRGINPKGPRAPQSMADAVEAFFGIREGDFAEVSDRRRRELAEQIILLADGTRGVPNLSVVDRGEGQHPEDFRDTFLSLVTGNKMHIPFVQGQHNMGGTGVVRYCGEKGYQLIVSRRDPRLLAGRHDVWGFCLIRRHLPKAGEPSSYLEYCGAPNGDVLTAEPAPVSVAGVHRLEQGTLIKLYNYQVPTTTVVTLDLWRDLNRRLYAPALPILVWETRDYRGHSPSKILLGNKVRVEVDGRGSVESALQMQADLGPLGMRRIDITVFRQGYRKDDFASPNDAILFTINGQTHANLGRSFLRTKAKLGYLADYMLIHVDCTDAPVMQREQTFMASRDRMASSDQTRIIEANLAEALGSHEALRELNELRRQQQIASHPQDTRFLETVIAKLARKNKNLLDYLRKGGPIKGGVGPGKRKVKTYEGKYIPTYLKAIGSNGVRPLVKQIPVNSYAVLHLETDASNDYLSRRKDRGVLGVQPQITKSVHLWNGQISVKLVPVPGNVPGTRIPVQVSLTRPDLSPLEQDILVQLTPASQPKKKENGETKPPPGSDYALPPPTLVYRDKRPDHRAWDEMDPAWDAQVVAKVVPSTAGVDVYINMDSAALHNFLRSRRAGQREEELILRSYETSIYLHSLVLHQDLSRFEDESIFDAAIQSVAKIALDLIHNASFEEGEENT